MILLCPPEKSTQFHYPLDPKKIRAEGSIHKDTTYQESDRQDFYRHGKKKQKQKKTRPSVRVHWVACGTFTVPDNFFQVGRSLRSHTRRGPLAQRSSHVRTTKQTCPCVICSSNSARYCFGIVYHCSAMVEVLGK